MSALNDFRLATQRELDAELRHAVNNHADNIKALGLIVQKQAAQISALLDGYTALTEQIAELKRG